jgi:hypothetical protein
MHIKFVWSNNRTRKIIRVTNKGETKLIQPETLGISQQDILLIPYGTLISAIKRKLNV